MEPLILDVLSKGRIPFDELCSGMAPHYTNRQSISAKLQSMRTDRKLLCTRIYEGKGGQVSIWEIAPIVSDALFDAWKMPVPFNPLPGTVRKHRLEL
jgi:hypothetical protein